MNKVIVTLTLLLPLTVAALEPSPYAADTDRAIKALSETERAGYLAGKGMGLARAAELNRYPGPRHALDLADELKLTTDQVTQLKRLFEKMESAAQTAGADFVAREAELDRLFASQRASSDQVLALTAEIGRLHGLVRAAHLNAHVATTAVLTPEQIARYVALRGYDQPGGASAHDPSKHPR